MPVSLCPLGTWAAGASFVNLRRVVGTEKHSLDKTVSGHAQNYNIRLASIKIRWFLQWLWFSGVLILIQSKFYSSLLSSQSLRSAQSQFSDCPCTYIFFFFFTSICISFSLFPYAVSHVGVRTMWCVPLPYGAKVFKLYDFCIKSQLKNTIAVFSDFFRDSVASNQFYNNISFVMGGGYNLPQREQETKSVGISFM